MGSAVFKKAAQLDVLSATALSFYKQKRKKKGEGMRDKFASLEATPYIKDQL